MNKRMQKKQFSESLNKEMRLLKFEMSLPKSRIGHKLIMNKDNEDIYLNYDKKTGKSFGEDDVYHITKNTPKK